MNAGCFGTEIKDILVSIQAIDKSGNVLTIPAKEINFDYRNNDLSDDLIFLNASFKGEKKDTKKIFETMKTHYMAKFTDLQTLATSLDVVEEGDDGNSSASEDDYESATDDESDTNDESEKENKSRQSAPTLSHPAAGLLPRSLSSLDEPVLHRHDGLCKQFQDILG